MYVFWSKQIGKIQQSRWVNHHIPHLHGNFGVCRMPDLGTEPCEIEVFLEKKGRNRYIFIAFPVENDTILRD